MVHQDVKWDKPLEGWYKLNVDNALYVDSRNMGFCCILRDSNGIFIVAKQMNGQAFSS